MSTGGSGTVYVCARCGKEYDRVPPTVRRPDTLRVRVGACIPCRRQVRELTRAAAAASAPPPPPGVPADNVRSIHTSRRARSE